MRFHWLASRCPNVSAPALTSRRPARLGLEGLEDRTAPATFRVTTPLDVVNLADNKLSLREAITQANASPGADVIVLPVGLFKVEFGGVDDDANVKGDLDIKDSVTI